MTTTDLAGLARGDRTSLAAIYNELSLSLLRMAYNVLMDRKAAAHVIEDAFVDLWNHRAYWSALGDQFELLFFKDVLRRSLDVLKCG